ncbi:hypothetical protein Z043_122985 [Scleropages formosus]|uniref:Uncharacterized protein n=1 Tax=Scleropages formosus TaxID=113540 RepID=A0A0P7W8F9_SCLFO|nr:hypothetical protein Z043_122985 [Scleropages formosus]
MRCSASPGGRVPAGSRQEGEEEGKERKSGDEGGLPATSRVTSSEPGYKKSGKVPSGKDQFRGTLTTRKKTRCAWAGKGEHAAILQLKCKERRRTFDCEYMSRLSSCPRFAGNIGLFWKQISRAPKKQKNPCQDPAALIKAAMCRPAPQEAHFKLNSPLTEHPPSRNGSEGTDRRKPASEYRGGSWPGFRNFFLSMVQSDHC